MRPSHQKRYDRQTDEIDDVEFHATKAHFEEDSIHVQAHGTEMGWLVSYADMMTLLFGLFVILFTIAHDRSKNIDSVMQEISAKYFNAVPGEVAKVPAKDTGKETSPAPFEKVAATPVPAAQLQPPKAPADENKNEIAQKDLEKMKADLDKEKAGIEDKANELAEESKKLASERLAISAKKKEMEQNLRSSGDKESEIEGLKKAIDAKDREMQGLKDEVDQLKKGQSVSPMQSYMMVILTWETKRHDIDLEVVDPHEKAFNFKRRKIAGEPGEFTLDSRYGPGMEMWKSANFVPGTYHAKVSFYNKNGNKTAAQAALTVVTNRSSYKSEAIVLPNQGDEGDITFSVEADGTVKFGP